MEYDLQKMRPVLDGLEPLSAVVGCIPSESSSDKSVTLHCLIIVLFVESLTPPPPPRGPSKTIARREDGEVPRKLSSKRRMPFGVDKKLFVRRRNSVVLSQAPDWDNPACSLLFASTIRVKRTQP